MEIMPGEKFAESKPVSQSQWTATAFGTLAVTLVVLIMVALASGSLGKPYIMDEMEFPSVARAIVETGKPIYYRGELYPSNTGLWHPPLYIAWYALWFRLFDPSVVSGRAFGLFNACLTLVLIGAFVMRRWHASRSSSTDLIHRAIALFIGLLVAATAPVLLQGSILPDIDTQVLPLTLTAFLLLLFELRRCGTRESVYWAVFVLGTLIQLYAKLPSLLLIVPTLAVFEIAQALTIRPAMHMQPGQGQAMPSIPRVSRGRLPALSPEWRHALAKSLRLLGSLAVALGLFVATWILIAGVWGVNARLPFTYLTQSTNNPVYFSQGQNFITLVIASTPEHFGYVIQWISWPMIVFVLLMLIREITRPSGGILHVSERAALYTFILLLTLLYIVLRPAPFQFPKYHPPIVPPLALLALDLLFEARSRRSLGGVLALLIGLVVLYLGYAAIRPTMAGRDFILTYYTEWPKTPFVLDWMIYPLGIAITACAVLWLVWRQPLLSLLATGALSVALGWQINLSIIQARAPYSTTYHYGEQSLESVIAYLRANLPDGVVIIAPKDLGSRLQDRWRYIELQPDPRPWLDKPGVMFLVTRNNDYYGNTIRDTPEIASAVQERFELATTIMNFNVWRRQS